MFKPRELIIEKPLKLTSWRAPLIDKSLFFPWKDVERANVLLSALTNGIRFVRDELQAAGFALTIPPVILQLTPYSDEQPFEYNYARKSLMVDVPQLQLNCQYDPSIGFSITEVGSDIPNFAGTLESFYYIGGVHETDHARWVQQNPDKPIQIVQGGPNIAHYAAPHELEAIHAELRAAEAQNMHEDTIRTIRNKISHVMQWIEDHNKRPENNHQSPKRWWHRLFNRSSE